MKRESNHIVNKVFLEIETKSEEKAMQIKNNASLFLEEELFPILEGLFNKYDVDGQIIRFSKLNVDFNVADWTNANEVRFEFEKCVERQLSKLKPNVSYDLQDEHNLKEVNLTKNLEVKQSILKPNIKYDLKDEYNLKEVKSTQNIVVKQSINTEDNCRETFLFFLENGYLPWFGKQEYIEQVVNPENWKTHLGNKQFLSELKRLLLKNELIIERMVFQFSSETILNLVQTFGLTELKKYSSLLVYINKVDDEERNIFLKYMLKSSLRDIVEESTQVIEKLRLFEELINIRFKSTALQVANKQVMQFLKNKESEFEYFFDAKMYTSLFSLTKINRKDIIENSSTIISKEFSISEKELPFFNADNKQIIIGNAGLVLFHPFLKTFFSNSEWINEQGKIKQNKQIEAVQALHYCASGNNVFFEDNLIFEKFLCNVPLSTPIPAESVLNNTIKTEVEAMLKETIKHWPALKNTSPIGLREMFVNRTGKLIQKEKSFRLIVERKAQDILLEKLPWNISIVKLPWKDDLLFVEW